MQKHSVIDGGAASFALYTKIPTLSDGNLAGATRLEHATDGFGDRNSTIELRPYAHNFNILSYAVSKVNNFGVLYEEKNKNSICRLRQYGASDDRKYDESRFG